MPGGPALRGCLLVGGSGLQPVEDDRLGARQQPAEALGGAHQLQLAAEGLGHVQEQAGDADVCVGVGLRGGGHQRAGPVAQDYLRFCAYKQRKI